MIVGIVAIGRNFAIGKEGKLPWHYSADLKFFKRTTTGNAIVMGYNTWESIGKPLPERLNVVLSRSRKIEADLNLIQLKSIEEVITFSKFLHCDLYIIGCAKTYESCANVIEKWIVTEIPLTIEDADAFMPSNFLDGFGLNEIEDLDDGLNAKIYEKLS